MNSLAKLEPLTKFELIRKYGGKLNRKFRPCIYHYDEGGGIRDEDLITEDGIDFLETDCITTKEILQRIFNAEKMVEIKLLLTDRLPIMNQLIQNYLKYGFCTVFIHHNKATDTKHWFTIININHEPIVEGARVLISPQTYLIQSYMDFRSYEIKPYSPIELFDKILCVFYDNNLELARELFGNVQTVHDIHYPIPSDPQRLVFQFHKFSAENNMNFEEAEKIVLNPSRGYSIA